MIGIIVGVVCALLLITATIMDFVMAGKQKDKSDKNTLVASGAITAIAAGIMIIAIVVLDTHCMSKTVQIDIQREGQIFDNSKLTAALLV